MDQNETNKTSKQNSRRNFIKNTALFAIVVSAPAVLSCIDKNKNNPDAQIGGCKTTDDILGPFYKANAPLQENIIPLNSLGTPLVLKGSVFSACDTIVSNAIVEIWNADENGNYDNVGYDFRGRFQTAADGLYRFTTIIPGKYLNGATYRPSHIHLKITAPGHGQLVSQIYFKDDPHISTDPWANSTKAKERILLIEEDSNGNNMVTFDIHLEKT